MRHSRRRRRPLQRKCPSRARAITVRISEWKNSPTSRWRPSMSSILTSPVRLRPASSSPMAAAVDMDAVMAVATVAVMVAVMVAIAAMVVAGASAAAAAAAVAASPGAVARPSAKRQANRLCTKRNRVWSMRPDPLRCVFRRPDFSATSFGGRPAARVDREAKAVTPAVALTASGCVY